MKRISIIITVFLLFFTLRVEAQIKVEASETVELMSILSRMAGFREYCMDMSGQYTKDTEMWFAPYKEHPIIAYYQGLRNNHSIGYDAVMSMAIHLDINNGEIKFLGEKSDLEKRWHDVDTDDFVAQLNKFYAHTRFHEFYQQHQEFYEEGLRTYEANVMQYFHQEWYARFYGTEPTEKFRVVIGFTNGGGNYGTHRQLSELPKEVFSIVGYYVNPQTGKAYEKGLDYASTLIHEFNHSFVNPLLNDGSNIALLKKIGQNLLKLSPIGMQQQNYIQWDIVINESIVRAAVVIYMLDNGFTVEQQFKEIFDNVCRDFRWMPELVAALRTYAYNRNQYKTLNDFYPEIARCLGKYLNDEKGRIEKALK